MLIERQAGLSSFPLDWPRSFVALIDMQNQFLGLGLKILEDFTPSSLSFDLIRNAGSVRQLSG